MGRSSGWLIAKQQTLPCARSSKREAENWKVLTTGIRRQLGVLKDTGRELKTKETGLPEQVEEKDTVMKETQVLQGTVKKLPLEQDRALQITTAANLLSNSLNQSQAWQPVRSQQSQRENGTRHCPGKTRPGRKEYGAPKKPEREIYGIARRTVYMIWVRPR